MTFETASPRWLPESVPTLKYALHLMMIDKLWGNDLQYTGLYKIYKYTVHSVMISEKVSPLWNVQYI